jgi:formamidopyrimidine-DNA glycosylase
MLHFGMTGFMKYFKNPEKSPAHNRLRLRFSNRYHLAYDCKRKLGEIALTDSPALFVEAKELGPDALDTGFDLDRFREIFHTRRASVKSALMNQKYIAGIGNIYSDEILFQAGVHPGTMCNQLDEDETKTLHSRMHHVLSEAIEARAEPSRLPSSFIIPHRRDGGICPTCKGRIEKTKIGGRTSYYCPQCQQRKGKG